MEWLFWYVEGDMKNVSRDIAVIDKNVERKGIDVNE